jgi:hypothetical protein
MGKLCFFINNHSTMLKLYSFIGSIHTSAYRTWFQNTMLTLHFEFHVRLDDNIQGCYSTMRPTRRLVNETLCNQAPLLRKDHLIISYYSWDIHTENANHPTNEGPQIVSYECETVTQRTPAILPYKFLKIFLQILVNFNDRKDIQRKY